MAYKLASRYKKYRFDAGGSMTQLNSGMGIAQSATGIIDGVFGADDMGRKPMGADIASGAMKGAAAGMVAGPYGAAAGAIIGGGVSYFTNRAQKSRNDALLGQYNMQKQDQARWQGEAAVAQDPSLIYGHQNASFYADGGELGGDQPPIRVKDPKDPRLQRYRDSLNVYNFGEKWSKVLKDTDSADAKIKFGIPSSAAFDKTLPAVKRLESYNGKELEPTETVEREFGPHTSNQGWHHFNSGYAQERWAKPKQPYYYTPDNSPKSSPIRAGVQPTKESPATSVGNLKPSNVEQQPTEYSFMHKGEGDWDQIMTYFPDEKSWMDFTDRVPYSHREYGKGYGRATGYAMGGQMETAGGVVVRPEDKVQETGAKARFRPLKDNYLSRMTKTEGGTLTPMSEDSVAVNGPSHEDGGVQLPEEGAEVEGGETIMGNFVFSDRLGFAQEHKRIARAIGNIQAKEVMSPERVNSIRRLQGREQQLAQSQELLKELLQSHQQ